MDSAAPSRGPASSATQANALLRKNLCFQRRNLKTNACITLFPLLLCVILVVLQGVLNRELDKPKYRCGCACVEPGPGGSCRRTECGVQYSTLDQALSCPVPSPPRWPALVQVPPPESRAVRTAASQPFDGLPQPSCRDTGSCPGVVLVTGGNRSLAESLSGGLFPTLSSPLNSTDYLDALSRIVVGSDTYPATTQFIEAAFIPGIKLYLVQPQCSSNQSSTISYTVGGAPLQTNIDCLQGLSLWRESSSVINDELFKGYRQQNGGSEGENTNEFVAGYDFLTTNRNSLEMNIWYNSTYNNNTAYVSIASLRVPRLVNMASNAYLKLFRGSGLEMLLEYVKEMPKVATKQKVDLSSLLGALFFTWIVELLFPVILTYIVYEKQQKLKIMMKMHGLKDGPYWLISYGYFFALSAVYMIVFVIFGSLIGLNFFKANAYSIQFVFYFIYINLQIALAFFVSSFFSSVKIATVVGYIYVFGSGLLGAFLLRFFVEDTGFPSKREVVEQLLLEPNANQAIICDNLKKIYRGKDGNPDKLAVRGLSLALPKGQCFGMLGPNGAGKTSFISMMIGLIPPTSGNAYVYGMDIKTDMDEIYTNMGELRHGYINIELTNMHDIPLQAVDDSLKSVNLFYGGVGNKQVGKYSGGMKRRLSVAISLFGDPKVVFMDEPSTGLDPASRNNLWSVVKEAKKNRAIILTTHSMEEAEVLCDRLGIFVDGGFQCLGNPKELKARYGGTYIFTMTTSSEHEQEVEQLVHRLSPSASRIYHISGTQKFELPKQEVKIADVFHAVESAKAGSTYTLGAWLTPPWRMSSSRLPREHKRSMCLHK
ncbi:hypothetical protein PR202_ga20870 [Eleusine coracana subsp. coracana]|uniref:ABC transporter domain-containing protein n=1 Tax=Eleusine coracana subsp. coracana TaxID=191504 RepID=A0AAV5CZE5_ELECO|nr:hypothetical protein PR202_ga20870 [Eleusine coracana subsp. coracana]